MGLARSAVDGVLRHFTTDQAVRAGVTTAAWSVAASYGRGLLPRTPVQQAGVTGAVVASHYVIGATSWSVIASTAAGLPGHRPGTQALLTAAALNAAGGKLLEMRLRHLSGDSLPLGAAWSTAKTLSVVGLAGGLVTGADVIAHDQLHVPRTPVSTLALDLAMGGLMAAGTIVRRRRRAQRFGVGPAHHPVAAPKTEDGSRSAVATAKSAGYVTAVAAGTALSLGGLAVGEQLLARQVSRALNAATHVDLGEFGDLLGHAVTSGGFATAAYLGLRQVRIKVERRADIIEPAYPQAPSCPYVSSGPRSSVAFDAIGKEGRRFVTMRLSARDIADVVGGSTQEPVRIIVPDHGSPQDRAALALAELQATGGLERSLICVASPTGVGYVSYVMAEALEYLTAGDCAIVVPQYAYVPSALALDQTSEGTQVQRTVIAAIRAELDTRPDQHRPRLVQFGESLGAQVAVDVAGERGIEGFDEVGLESGLYLGVPFRSAAWRSYLRAPDSPIWAGRLVNTPDAEHCPARAGCHVMVNHHDDPINKFAYTMAVQRPWWLGPAETRPPLVPRETYFRPVTSFVIGLVDLLNGMNMKPGSFRRVGHDYRFDMREALQKAYSLPIEAQQAARIEGALRSREQQWAELRLVAKAGDKALLAIRETINSWGRDSVNIELHEQPTDAASSRLLEYLSSRLSSLGPLSADSGANTGQVN